MRSRLWQPLQSAHQIPPHVILPTDAPEHRDISRWHRGRRTTTTRDAICRRSALVPDGTDLAPRRPDVITGGNHVELHDK
jgi:hypothetical protein